MSPPDVRAFTVGPVQENAYIVTASAPSAGESGADPAASERRSEGGDPAADLNPTGAPRRALIVDPGEEPERLLAAARALGVEIEAILITHCHFDHVGAVAPLARATRAPVYCPEIERAVLADVMAWAPPGFGPFESYEAEHLLAGGERLSLAGLEIEVLFTPGHSPGHLTYAISEPEAQPATQAPEAGGSDAGMSEARVPPSPVLLSGDVLFQGSVGRTDLPGADRATLEGSIATLLERFPGETVVYPGHMGVTTLGRERDTNPFLHDLRATAAAGPATTPPRGAPAS